VVHCSSKAGEKVIALDLDSQGSLVRWSERRITQDEYDKKARELKERKSELAARLDQHQKGDGEYRTTLESPVSLASRQLRSSSVRKPTRSANSSHSCFLT
jgi:cellulose biosynthesis protein BcsQ